ncbi:PglZ domain-containing protein [Peptoniphilus lacrimalis]|uniref:Type I phosphodiesterase / nucleotide pyrophosphatase n=1 Tax=Gardnerella pickettii JCP7719 TaxID=1261061 RepID=S4GXL0_9BIFI|nr:alkaline phosphatase family protein [Gardnerella pickettii]EPI50628.1 type I phosphodiesterase / nucleotide pyrophosphatase [Gardnerella pickettii JCP7719]PMC45582.1 PglZ domain-containing protein [Peptoniphilus lacrimalis]
MTIEIPQLDDLLKFVENSKISDAYNNPKFALHLSSILPALSASIGSPICTQIHKNPDSLRDLFGFPKVKSAVVVLVDGLGYWNLAIRKGHAPYLRALLNNSANQRPITTCVPSTTVAAMATFGTGTCPGLTAMTGYTQKNPKTGALSQLIQFRDAPNPLDLQRQPTIFESLSSLGVRANHVSLSKFEDSPLTQAAFRGAKFISGTTARARIMNAANSTKTPGLTYLYLRDIDKIGHNYGWESENWVSIFEQIDAQLNLLRKNCQKGTLIVITADHGMIESNPDLKIDIAKDSRLTKGVNLVGGEPRSVMLYAEDGANPEDIALRWTNALQDKALVRTKEQAVKDGVFGEVSSLALSVIGDVLVQAKSSVTIVDSRIETEKAMNLPSVHGSMSAMEMDIPCLVDIA